MVKLWRCVSQKSMGAAFTPPVANGDSGKKPLFHTQTLASESKALHGRHIIASHGADRTDRGSLWVSSLTPKTAQGRWGQGHKMIER